MKLEEVGEIESSGAALTKETANLRESHANRSPIHPSYFPLIAGLGRAAVWGWSAVGYPELSERGSAKPQAKQDRVSGMVQRAAAKSKTSRGVSIQVASKTNERLRLLRTIVSNVDGANDSISCHYLYLISHPLFLIYNP